MAFRRENCQIKSIEVVPHRIDKDRRYEVETINEKRDTTAMEKKGQDLINGILLSIPEKGQSLVWRYRAI